MTLHNCIRPSCGKEYTDNEPENYYCPSCVKEKEAIAKKIDARFSSKEREPVVSELQAFEQGAKKSKYFDPATGMEIERFIGRA